MMIFKEPKIVFHHVPKCGGTSIVAGIALTYYPFRLLFKGRGGFSARLNSPKSTKSASENNFDRYDYRRDLLAQHLENETCPFISGHYPFSDAAYTEHKNEWDFVTLLRDPITRWYSEYDWNRHKDHDYHKTDLSLEEYLETPEGIANTRSFVNFYGDGQYGNIAMPTKKEIDMAKQALQKMSVIGCLENLDRFRSDMRKRFGRKPIFLNLNASPAPVGQKSIPDIHSDCHKKLLERLEADIEIYQEARKIIGM